MKEKLASFYDFGVRSTLHKGIDARSQAPKRGLHPPVHPILLHQFQPNIRPPGAGQKDKEQVVYTF
jgi:hypothetical protein